MICATYLYNTVWLFIIVLQYTYIQNVYYEVTIQKLKFKKLIVKSIKFKWQPIQADKYRTWSYT